MELSKKEHFKKIFLNDSYMTWLSNYMTEESTIDNLYFLREHNNDKEMLEYLNYLFVELQSYYIKNNKISNHLQKFYIKYKDKYYEIGYDGECIYCKVYNKCVQVDFDYVEYSDLKEHYNIEEFAEANNIKITRLDDILSIILNNTSEFYDKITKSLTLEERLLILLNLQNKSCDTCQINENCSFEAYDIEEPDENGIVRNTNCQGWFNSELIGKSKVLKINDINKLK